MATIIFGNAPNLSVSDDNSDGDTIILGNGAHDLVSASLQPIRHDHPRQWRRRHVNPYGELPVRPRQPTTTRSSLAMAPTTA